MSQINFPPFIDRSAWSTSRFFDIRNTPTKVQKTKYLGKQKQKALKTNRELPRCPLNETYQTHPSSGEIFVSAQPDISKEKKGLLKLVKRSHNIMEDWKLDKSSMADMLEYTMLHMDKVVDEIREADQKKIE
jgi:hypothetical protein